VRLSVDLDTSGIPAGALSVSYDGMRRELEAAKSSVKEQIDSANKLSIEKAAVEKDLADLKERYARDQKTAQEAQAQSNQTIATEKAAAAKIKASDDERISTLNAQLETSQKQVNSKQAELNSKQAELGTTQVALNGANRERITNGSVFQSERNGNNVEIFFVSYGGEPIWNNQDGVGDRLLGYAHSKQAFQLREGNGQVFTRDPWGGVLKSATIVYRYNRTGPLRWIEGKQHAWVSFEGW
ncbi:MAG: hypothetical protein HETSPECPRED_004482, partial [Heterodermia speciosa]